MNNGILLTGATGFIGSSILRALSPEDRAQTTVLVRSPVALPPVGRTVVGDLGDRGILRRALEGIGTVIHAASYIGYDVELCDRVNVEGTRNLADEAMSLGVSRLLYLSTTAVLGAGPHRGSIHGSTPQGPVSALSASRRLAERAFERAGGLSIRPALVVGVGDRWVIPAIRRLTIDLDATVDEGRALKSIIHVDDLGRLIARLARGVEIRTAGTPPSVIAALPQPARVKDLLVLLARHRLIDQPPETSLTSDEAEAATPPPDRESVRRLYLDHHFDAVDIWEATGLAAPDALTLAGRDVEHYRRLIGGAAT